MQNLLSKFTYRHVTPCSDDAIMTSSKCHFYCI